MEHLWPGPALEGCVMASERPEPEVRSGRAGAALVLKVQEGESGDQALLWPPPGLGATRPRSLGRGPAQP